MVENVFIRLPSGEEQQVLNQINNGT